MGDFLEHASGLSYCRDSYQAGTEAAQQALKQITKFEPTLVVVFASVSHELERALAGVSNTLGKVPLIGCSTAGEYSARLLSGTVTVTVFASPYMDVKVGIGRRVFGDYANALHEVIKTAGAADFFNFGQDLAKGPETLDHTCKPFAFIFMPGPVRHQDFKGKEIVDLIRKRTFNSLPLVGACAGDDCKWEKTYQFYNGQVYEDALVMAFVKTNLKFGISTVYNYVPGKLERLLITETENKVILKIYGKPAADYYAELLGIELGELMADPCTYFYNHPFGAKDISGFYHIFPGVGITSDHGIRCLHQMEEGTALNIMEPSSEQLLISADAFLRKAILRGQLRKPMAGMIFSSVHRVNSLRELIPLALLKIQKSLNKPFNLSGFCAYGEIGLTDENVSSYFNMTLSGLLISDELNEATLMAQKNIELNRELKEAASRNRELYQELSIVHDLGNLLNSSLKLGFVINKAVNMVAQLMKADGSILFLYNKEKDALEAVSHFGFGEMPQEIDLTNTLPYQAIKEEKRFLVKHPGQFPEANLCLLKHLGGSAAIVSPIIIKKQKVGVIAVYSSEPSFYSKKDLEFLETLANQIGIALVNADLYEKTEFLACTDGLTGLYDHNYFLQRLEGLMDKAEKKEEPLSLIMVDLDDFKYINDKYGHTVGDIILKTTARILQDNVRADDVIARYGGDEFAIVLVNAGEKKARRIGERIGANLANEPFSDPESRNVFFITASVGSATYPMDASSGKELIDVADKSMYQMKRNTKTRMDTYLTEFEELEAQLTASEKALLDTIKLLIQVLDSRDRYTWEHCRQVARYAMGIAEKMDLPKELVSKLKLAGYLHDMGKIHVNPEVLNKRGWLSEKELETVKLHPIVGANLLSPIKGFQEVRDIIFYHHEWFNGRGYPEGLKGGQIPLGSRILAVADGFDAMTSNRPYRKAQTFEWAIKDLQVQSGTQYDPEVVEVFIEFLSEKGQYVKEEGS